MCFFRPALTETIPRDARWPLCPAEPGPPAEPASELEGLRPGTVELRADEGYIVEQGTWTLSGNVQLTQDKRAVRADRMTYDSQQQRFAAIGHVQYWDDSLFWSGERASVDRRSDIARLDAGDYRLLDRRGRGAARVTTVDIDNEIARLRDVDYTTCPGEVSAWKLAAKDLRLDRDKDQGRALNVMLEVKDVPVLYIPYISFPLSDKRKSGVLPPSFGTTKTSGADIRIPYYWNIAPAQDATITARILSNRGVMLGGQYRYLTRAGQGQLDFEYLPNDSKFDDDDRSLVGVQVKQPFLGTRGDAEITFSRVSDKEYFEDFGNSLSLSSTRLLDQRGDLTYRGDRWRLLGRLQSFQTVDTSLAGTDRPYKRLPQILFNTQLPGGNRRLNFQFRGEGVYFDRKDSVVGARIDLAPEVSYPIRAPGSFLIPKLKFRHTQYFLENISGSDDDPSRTLPVLTIDSGLYLDRNYHIGETSYLHTLEPRLFYLFIPETDQDDIPVFDTGEFDISFAQLFRDNRFNGPDRIGDSNQLSLALTTRFLNRNTGLEQLRASVGQIFFFQDRKVTLPFREFEDDSTSELVARIGARITENWSARYDLQWDPNDNETDKATADVNYRSENGTVFNLGYRFRRTESKLEQTDLSFRWPVLPKLDIVGRWNYSLQQAETLEVVGGIEYESCCWGVRTVVRRFLSNAEGEFDNEFFIQLELKGLGGIGQKTVSFLKKSIPGYETEF